METVCRDRYSDYIEGIRQGAPAAIQITDRWYLLRNMSDAVLAICTGIGKELQETSNLLAMQEMGGELIVEKKPETPSEKTSPQDELLQDVKNLAQQGYSNRQIAKMFPIHRETVARYKQEDRVPVRGGGKKHTAVSYKNFILQRWHEGCHSSKQIFLEMQMKGFTGSLSSTYRYLIYLGMQTGQPEQKLQPRRLTASQAAWTITAPEQKLDDHQKKYRDILFDLSPKVLEASGLANRFIQMVKEQKKEQFAAWIEDALNCDIPRLRSFANGLVADYQAVEAALSFDWSNGQLEGQMNRLKTNKRMMYGKASFDLLKKKGALSLLARNLRKNHMDRNRWSASPEYAVDSA